MGYIGAKGGSGVYQRIIAEMPPHRVYVECFLGSGAIMRLKRPARVNIGVEIVPGVLAAYGDEISRAVGALLEDTAMSGDSGRVELVCADAVSWLDAYPWVGDELVYCDPPYLMDTRRCQRAYYRHEFATPLDHAGLLGALRRLPCLVAISGYWSELYAGMLPDWRCVQFPAMTRGGLAEECLWCNYPEPLALHDYRYLGVGYRERERIKRKTQRWVARLARMDVLERRALLAAISTLDHR